MAFPGIAVLLQTLTNNPALWQWLYLPAMVWLALVILLIGLLLRKYPFGNWSADHPNPYQQETLGLPRGVMRGVLTLTLLFMVVLLEIFTIRFENFETRIGDFMVAFQMMLSFYFGSKVMHHLTSVDERKNAASAKTAEVIQKHRIQESQKTGQPDTTSGNSEKDFEDEKAVG